MIGRVLIGVLSSSLQDVASSVVMPKEMNDDFLWFMFRPEAAPKSSTKIVVRCASITQPSIKNTVSSAYCTALVLCCHCSEPMKSR